MNKAYRIIWNTARKFLMAVCENLKSRSKDRKNRKASLLNVLSAVLLSLGASRDAQSQSVITEPLYLDTPYAIPDNSSLLVDGTDGNTGAIVITAPATTAVRAAGSIIQNISNRGGTISNSLPNTSGGGTGGIFIGNVTITSGVTNSELITGLGFGVLLDSNIKLSGGINNQFYGTIQGGILGIGIQYDSTTISGGISNSGLIRRQ